MKARKSGTTHGMSGTHFYKAWDNMRQRALNPNYVGAANYSKRGIYICSEWENSFEIFRDQMYGAYLAHVAEHGERNTTLDRRDNSLGYVPGNVRFATYKVQANNRRKRAYRTANV